MVVSVAVRVVREELERRGWNHAEFARQLRKHGVTVAEGLVSRWLSGQRKPDRDRSAAIRELLGVDPRQWATPKKRRAS